MSAGGGGLIFFFSGFSPKRALFSQFKGVNPFQDFRENPLLSQFKGVETVF